MKRLSVYSCYNLSVHNSDQLSSQQLSYGIKPEVHRLQGKGNVINEESKVAG